jgi:hypothetical protein
VPVLPEIARPHIPVIDSMGEWRNVILKSINF